MPRFQRLIVVAAVVLLTGCATVLPTLHPATVTDDRALDAAVEAFYQATSVADLRAAVDSAARIAPGAARFHEIAARLALLDGHEDDALQHLKAAVLDTGNDSALLHLHQLMTFDQSYAEREHVRDLLFVLGQSHPDPTVRAVASYHLASLLNAEHRLEERDAATASIPGRLSFSIVGTWDNDSGKAFDAELAPEARPGFDQVYEGRSGRLHWRRDPPVDPRGRLDLSALMTPSRWAAAFAQAMVVTEAPGPHELRLMSTGPLKVWVDGKLVFSASQLERSVFDHLVVPLNLKAGAHTVLVKSAHREGQWFLAGRLVSSASSPAVSSIDDVLAWHVRRLPEDSARTASLRAQWAHGLAGGTFAVKRADAAVKAWPRSIVARMAQVDALWFNQERGRTADLLQALDTDVGDGLAFVRLRHIRFQQQQGQKQKARDRLLELSKNNPTVREANELLISTWRSEGWAEDELRAEQTLAERFGATPDDDNERAFTLVRLGRRAEAIALLESILERLPGHAETVRRLADLSLEMGELETAEGYLEDRLESWPTDYNGWLQLGEVRRRMGHRERAQLAIDKAAALSPESATPQEKTGDLAYQAGQVAPAVTAWRRALIFNPENEALANRVDFLSPEARGPWMADVPDEAAIERAIKLRNTLTQTPGADVAWLLDHEVTLLNSDGSTINVITEVAHAFNAQGRDRLMRQSIPSGGRVRMMASYSIDEKGVRTEAGGERSRQVLFRGLQPGATLVMQYRLDVPPQGYLSRYLTKSWSFQSVSEQRSNAEFIVWAPLGVTLHEERVGAVVRSQDKRGEQMRVVWSATNVPPLIAEPSMPTSLELAANIRISTVPDWQTWLSWEQALLDGAFRDSPDIDALAKTLSEGSPDEVERLKRIHQFVMEEIRYQQDYETFIAGVKPHAAPVVLERKYGDCKDKAVLFIELAKKLGLDAHFALVRTRDAGPVMRDVPMQQFNHAIVYVPVQKGVKEARFFDPTAELLDLDTVRSDDVGTKSLVFDPKSGVHTWRDIELQAPEFNREKSSLALTLDKTGAVKGTLTVDGVGRDGSLIRRVARNAELLNQSMQRMSTSFLPNATTSNAKGLEVKSLRVPGVLQVDLEAKTFARVEGDTLRARMPTDWNPRSMFTLATRRHPLVLGAPTQTETRVALTLPEGFEVKKLPMTSAVELPCLSLKREVKQEGSTVTSLQTFRNTCERITATEYSQYRSRVDDMVRMLDDELVIAPTAVAGKSKPKTPAVPPSR